MVFLFDFLQKSKALTTETLSHGVFYNSSTCADRRYGVNVSVSSWFKKESIVMFVYLCKMSNEYEEELGCKGNL